MYWRCVVYCVTSCVGQTELVLTMVVFVSGNIYVLLNTTEIALSGIAGGISWHFCWRDMWLQRMRPLLASWSHVISVQGNMDSETACFCRSGFCLGCLSGRFSKRAMELCCLNWPAVFPRLTYLNHFTENNIGRQRKLNTSPLPAKGHKAPCVQLDLPWGRDLRPKSCIWPEHLRAETTFLQVTNLQGLK
jgi:hypothetical protein